MEIRDFSHKQQYWPSQNKNIIGALMEKRLNTKLIEYVLYFVLALDPLSYLNQYIR